MNQIYKPLLIYGSFLIALISILLFSSQIPITVRKKSTTQGTNYSGPDEPVIAHNQISREYRFVSHTYPLYT